MTDEKREGLVPCPNCIYGFYEGEFPLYTNIHEANPSLSYLATPKEVNSLVDEIQNLRHELNEARAEVHALREKPNIACGKDPERDTGG